MGAALHPKRLFSHIFPLKGVRMAKFVISIDGGKFETALEGKNGEELSPEMVSAYAHMKVGWALGEIADRLVGIDNSLNAIADAIRDMDE